jgi:hypothetical protein
MPGDEEMKFPSGSQMEECCEGSPPPTSHLCGVGVVNASFLSETICGVYLEIRG